MNIIFKCSPIQLNSKRLRSIIYLSFFLLLTSCASAILVERAPLENDERTELQRQLDTEISEKINQLYQSSSVVSATALHISTYKHVVTINGFVGTKSQKKAALRLALSVSGVKSVVSDIGIRKY